MLKKCICRTCGRSFQGGPRAWDCPECRVERKKIEKKRYQLRKKLGISRVMGDKDKCKFCGKEYIIESANQYMCPDCRPEKYAEHDRITSLEFYHEKKEDINPIRNQKRRIGKRNCEICGKEYDTPTNTLTCSAECKRIRKNRKWLEGYHRRKEQNK